MLGALIERPDCLWKAEIVAEHFADEHNREVFRTLQDMLQQGMQIDVVSLCSHNKSLTMADVSALLERGSDNVWNDKSLFLACDQLKEKGYRRVLQKQLFDATRQLEGGADTSVVLETLSKVKPQHNAAVDDTDPLQGAFDQLDLHRSVGDKMLGVDTLSPTLNLDTRGFHGARAIIVAGRPGLGKSQYALSIATKAALDGHAVGIFSIEMTLEEWALRTVSNITGMAKDDLVELPPDRYAKMQVYMRETFKKYPLLLSNANKLNQIVAQINTWKQQHDLKMVVIDYLQNIRVLGYNDERLAMKEASRTLAALKNALGIPIICVAAMNRNVERNDRKPILSDLRECGDIESDADMVLFLYEQEEQLKMRVGKSRFSRQMYDIDMHLEGGKSRIAEVNNSW